MRLLTKSRTDQERYLLCPSTHAQPRTNGTFEIEVLSWVTRTALELVGQSGLGYSFDTLTDDAVPHPFSKSVKRMGLIAANMRFLRSYILAPLTKVGTAKFRRFVVDAFPWKDLHELRDHVDVLHQTSVEIIESKRAALAAGDEALREQVGQGKDILSILRKSTLLLETLSNLTTRSVKANMNASKGDVLTDQELFGQVS